MNPTSETFLKLGNKYTKSNYQLNEFTSLRRFKSFFGLTPLVCSIVWEKIAHELPVAAEPKHLLWSLSFLKQYSVEHNRHSIFGADEKTLRKWTWIFVRLLSNLNVILWEKRFDGALMNQTCFCSLDGVDCKILEPTPFNPIWFSHKFNGPGLRYEIALNIRTGHIVWANGGYPCGQVSDLKLARESYVHSVNCGEKTIADRVYKDQHFILPNEANKKLHKRILARHETVNKRLKQFRILKESFRHDKCKHPMVFHAVSNLTQIMLENGEPLYSVL